MLKNFQRDSWGLIPPLHMPSLLPHDLCHGWSSSRWLPAVTEFQLSYSRSWKMMLWKVLHSICSMHSICNMPAPGINCFMYLKCWCSLLLPESYPFRHFFTYFKLFVFLFHELLMSEFYMFSWIVDLFHTDLVKVTILPMFILPILEKGIS